MKTDNLADYLDTLLRTKEIADESLNGLQVANRGDVHKVGLAVDASMDTFERAVQEKVDFLLVHHGLFWEKPLPIRGNHYDRVLMLLESDIALYAAHLPIDLHAELGNNAQIAVQMEWPIMDEFGLYHGYILGREVLFKQPVSVDTLVESIGSGLNCKPLVWDFGPEEIHRLAFVSGGGIGLLEEAIDKGMDAYFTGEPKHSAYWLAKEAGIHVIFGGHYATETLGIQAIGKNIEKEFGLNTVFLDLPTGH